VYQRSGVTIRGFSRHGINQMISRGIRPYEIRDAVYSPVRLIPGRNGVVRFIGRWADIRINANGIVITGARFKDPLSP
jgi:hypothetical protein